MNSLKGGLTQQGIEIAFTWPVGVDWRRFESSILKKLRSCDAIIVNGEGTIHHTLDRPRALYTVATSSLALKAGLPSFLINATIFEVCDSALAHLRNFTYIYVRDESSKSLLASKDIQSKKVGDLSMAAFKFQPSQARRGILVTDSVSQEVTEILKQADGEEVFYESMRFKTRTFPIKHCDEN